MISNNFRNQLESVVRFIFDHDKEFIKKFINEKLIKCYIERCEIIDINLENVFLSNSRVFIRVTYHVNNLPNDKFDYKNRDFFLDSNEVFDWINDFSNRKQLVNQEIKMVVELSPEDKRTLDFICSKVKITEKEKIILSIILKFKKIQSSCIAHESKGVIKINNIYGQLTRLVKKNIILQSPEISKIGQVDYKIVFNEINERAWKILD